MSRMKKQWLGGGRKKLKGLDPHPTDIESAKLEVGVCTIALRCGGWQDRDLAKARAIYTDTADLLSQL